MSSFRVSIFDFSRGWSKLHKLHCTDHYNAKKWRFDDVLARFNFLSPVSRFLKFKSSRAMGRQRDWLRNDLAGVKFLFFSPRIAGSNFFLHNFVSLIHRKCGSEPAIYSFALCIVAHSFFASSETNGILMYMKTNLFLSFVLTRRSSRALIHFD